ncbi:MAG: hypothetical protein ACF8SC_04145 [Phycisphaerales bacterium JB037]
MPVHDPEFWVVTAAALAAFVWLCWRITPIRRLLRRKRTPRGRRATLTVGGRPIE